MHPHTKKNSFMFMKVKGNIQFIFSLNLNRILQYSGNWFFCWQIFATWQKTIIKKLVWLIQRIFVKKKCAKVAPNLNGYFIWIFQIYTICFKPITKYSRILKFVFFPFWLVAKFGYFLLCEGQLWLHHTQNY